jgi:hypothetical protein
MLKIIMTFASNRRHLSRTGICRKFLCAVQSCVGLLTVLWVQRVLVSV